ncbi:MAG: hypothetical protein IJ200_12910 [Prevotella sp.]|nr:hypothetical protein [Prevotella sp.]
MKVDFSKSFMDAQGKPVIVGNNPQVIGEQLCFTLFNLTTVKGAPATQEQKYTAYKLLKRIQADASSVEISTEEGTFIKELAAEVLSAGGYGQVVDIIENN